MQEIELKYLKEFQSLQRMFESEYFTLDMHVDYLFKFQMNTHVVSYLSQKLYKFPDHEIDFYLTQLCYLVLVLKNCQDLCRFLYDKAAKSFSIYLKIAWLVNSFGQYNSNDANYDEKSKRTEKIERCIEMSMVNCEVREGFVNNNQNNQMFNQIQDAQEIQKRIMLNFMEKEARSNYNCFAMKVINNLVKLSISLKNYDIQIRNEQLRSNLKKILVYIQKNRSKYQQLENSVQAKMFEGVIFPFQIQPNENFQSNLIVDILIDQCFCFNTKMRVPYKIVIETIDMNDPDIADVQRSKMILSPSLQTSIKKSISQINNELDAPIIEVNDFNVNIDYNQALQGFASNDQKDEIQQNKLSWIKNLFTKQKKNNSLIQNSSIENFHQGKKMDPQVVSRQDRIQINSLKFHVTNIILYIISIYQQDMIAFFLIDLFLNNHIIFQQFTIFLINNTILLSFLFDYLVAIPKTIFASNFGS